MNTSTAVPKRIFVVWLGPSMSDARIDGLHSIEAASGLPIELIDESNLRNWEVKSSPIHPAFELLTAIQKSDYLRSYLMHHHGGGYTDIKPCVGSWEPALGTLNSSSNCYGIGYQEIGRHGVAHLGLNLTKRLELRLSDPSWWKYRWLQLHYKQLLGNCSFIFRPRTPFTECWFSQLTLKLDFYHEQLKLNPGRHPKERPGHLYDFGVSNYPIAWGELMANIFHPLCLKFRNHLLQTLPPPLFLNYE